MTKKSQGPGRPAKFKDHERWNRTTVVLRDWEVAFLDRLAADVRETSGVALNRSDLIRECISVLVVAQEEKLLRLDWLKDHSVGSQLSALINETGSKRRK